MRDVRQTVVVGVIKAIEKKEPTGAKITKVAAQKGKLSLLLPSTFLQRKGDRIVYHTATWCRSLSHSDA